MAKIWFRMTFRCADFGSVFGVMRQGYGSLERQSYPSRDMKPRFHGPFSICTLPRGATVRTVVLHANRHCFPAAFPRLSCVPRCRGIRCRKLPGRCRRRGASKASPSLSIRAFCLALCDCRRRRRHLLRLAGGDAHSLGRQFGRVCLGDRSPSLSRPAISSSPHVLPAVLGVGRPSPRPETHSLPLSLRQRGWG